MKEMIYGLLAILAYILFCGICTGILILCGVPKALAVALPTAGLVICLFIGSIAFAIGVEIRDWLGD
jgi:hypothetical protein